MAGREVQKIYLSQVRGIYMLKLVTSAYKILYGDGEEQSGEDGGEISISPLAPKEIHKILDDYVLGKREQKKDPIGSRYNHYKRI